MDSLFSSHDVQNEYITTIRQYMIIGLDVLINATNQMLHSRDQDTTLKTLKMLHYATQLHYKLTNYSDDVINTCRDCLSKVDSYFKKLGDEEMDSLITESQKYSLTARTSGLVDALNLVRNLLSKIPLPPSAPKIGQKRNLPWLHEREDDDLPSKRYISEDDALIIIRSYIEKEKKNRSQDKGSMSMDL